MSWLQFRLDTSAELAPGCEDWLLAMGAVAVTLQDNADQPLFDKDLEIAPLWRQTRVTGLFPAATDAVALRELLPEALRSNCTHKLEILEDKDWEREWMQHYQPLQYSENLWVVPSWMEPPDPGAINILLDPGLAFGTGTHPTTTLCLKHLQQLQPAGKTVIDYGCGSGVLAIAALLMGAEMAYGIDTDPQAILASRDNAQRNHIQQGRLELGQAGLRVPQAELVVANILAGPLCQLAATLCQLLLPGAELLLSGILSQQVDELMSAYADWLTLEVRAQQEDWVVLYGKYHG